MVKESGGNTQQPAVQSEDSGTGQTDALAESTENAADSKQEDCNKENLLGSMDSEPPTPTSVPPIAAFTSKDTIQMDTSADRKEDDISLIVHVDESQNEFDMPGTPAKSTDDNSNQETGSVELIDSKIEEKAALDAEKDFKSRLAGDNAGVSVETQDANEASKEEKTGQDEKMETESSTAKEDNQGKTGTATTTKDESSATKESRLVLKQLKQSLPLCINLYSFITLEHHITLFLCLCYVKEGKSWLLICVLVMLQFMHFLVTLQSRVCPGP